MFRVFLVGMGGSSFRGGHEGCLPGRHFAASPALPEGVGARTRAGAQSKQKVVGGRAEGQVGQSVCVAGALFFHL